MIASTLAKASIGAKILELILACACIALFESAYKQPFNMLLPITFGGYIIICGLLIAAMFLQQRASRFLDLAFTAVGMVLFLAAGVIALEFYTKVAELQEHHDDNPIVSQGLAMGSLAIINCLVFLADLIIVYKDVHEYNPQQ